MTEKVKENKATLSDIEIQNVVHIEQVDDGAISFSVIVSCDIEHSISSTGRVSFTEKWIDVRCNSSNDFGIVLRITAFSA